MPVVPSNTAKDRLKRYVPITEAPTLDDADIAEALIEYAMLDSSDRIPGATGWVETYDIYGAAAQAWRWKAGKAAQYVNTSADNQRFDLSDLQKHCDDMVTKYEQLRMTGTVTVIGLA